MNREPIKPETIVRTICLIIALANQILAIYGKERIPVTDDEIYQLVSIIATIIVSVWTWWKNNSFTQPALKADIYMERLRKQEKEA